MIPVELQLTNFLSYGTEAPPLRFEQFRVACLSGRNGQGKSALLDAMTWALWGEARKSSGNRKPDDDLIRIGTRHMQVDFCFDVEGERYRVSRTYQRSATGKTTKSNLEFHLCQSAGDYRPLTAQSQRETQALIDNALGLDYDTFINSAFLLQGRSDEFTKKRPSERKEILTRILDLSRYKALAALAGERRRGAKERQQAAAQDIDRLKASLEHVPAWKRERKELREEAEAKREALSAARAEEKALTERLAGLEATAREAASIQKTLASLERRLAEHAGDAEKLRGQIDGAGQLLARKDEIARDFERHQALQAERDELDTRRDLHGSIEKQIEQQRGALKDCKNDLEKKLHRLEVEQKAQAQEIRQIEAQLSKRPALRQALEGARAAAEKVQALAETRTLREKLKEKMASLKTRLSNQQEALKAQLTTLTGQAEQKARALPDAEELKQRRKALADQHKERAQVEAAQAERVEAGQALREAIREEEALLGARAEARAEQERQLEQLRASSDSTCPTCGTALTEAHRAQAERRLRASLAALDDEMKTRQAVLNEREAERTAKRAAYQRAAEQLAALDGTAEKLATVAEQLRACEAEAEAQAARREEAAALQTKIEEKQYGQDARARWRTCQKKLQALDFDEETYARLQHSAAQAEQVQAQLRELEEQGGRREQLRQRQRATEGDVQALRTQLDDGSAFAQYTEQIAALREKLGAVGFDGERFEAVRGRLRALAEAGNRMKDLLHARQNREAWKEQLGRTQERLEAARAEKEQAEKRQAALNEALAGKAEAEQRRQEAAATRRQLDDALGAVQRQAGELNAQLERARADRTRLTARRQVHAEAKSQRALYKHLRTAFGKHGIPSLIIEETLPEIEERANSLLRRLSDGKMHVRLETLKDKKTGGTKETLDIIITDEQGVPRPYETFSGGEAFRVNFALRIALAQLLAERSGVRIRTLVIDEGFGTQDPQGIRSLVEAIRAIQADFDKILVITHLEELKQVFPVRIEVEKDPATGSSFEMLGV